VKQVFELGGLLKDMKTQYVEFGNGLRSRLIRLRAIKAKPAPARIELRPVTLPLRPSS
jgi:hypothetical protein